MSTLIRWVNVRIIKPAPTSRTNPSATSDVTSRDRYRLLPEIRALPPDFRASWTFVLDDSNDGARPKTIPARSEMAKAYPRTGKLNLTASSSTMVLGRSARSHFIPHQPRNNPAIPPSRDRKTLSVSSWRMTRPRDAPSAVRSARRDPDSQRTCRTMHRRRVRHLRSRKDIGSLSADLPGGQ